VTFNPSAPGATTRSMLGAGLAMLGVACPLISQCTAVGGPNYGENAGGVEVTFDPAAPGTPTPTLIDPGANHTLGPPACP
jgi:hypothetical protein